MEIKRLTDEEYQKLQGFSEELRLAKGNVIPGFTKAAMELLFGIYNRVTGYSEKPTGCGSCNLRALRVLNTAIEEYEAEKNNIADTSKTLKKKNGRTDNKK